MRVNATRLVSTETSVLLNQGKQCHDRKSRIHTCSLMQQNSQTFTDAAQNRVINVTKRCIFSEQPQIR